MSNEKEIQVMLKILAGDDDIPADGAGFDADELVRLARMHKLNYSLLLYAQNHHGFLSQQRIDQLEAVCRKNAVRSLQQLHALMEVARLFTENGVQNVVIKGPQLARTIYGREVHKESVDLDIMLVDKGDQLKVHRLLTDFGYSRSNYNDYKTDLGKKIFLIAKREIHYFNPGNKCAIDLHIRPGANTYLTEKLFKGFLNDRRLVEIDGVTMSILNDESYFVYLCYHGALHQYSRLAWLIDIRAFYIQKRDTLNLDKVVSIARHLGAEQCLYLTFYLLQRYFHDKLPEGTEEQRIINRRIIYLASICLRLIGKPAGYSLTLKGRIGKLGYIMVLLQGIASRIDWIYGIFVRFLIVKKKR